MNIIKKIINLHSSIFGLILILSIFLTVTEYFNLKEYNKINNNSRISSQTNSLGGIFDIDNTKLTGKGSYAFAEAEQELASNNRLGGSSDMYEKQISEKVRIQNGIPRDPKKRPNPYNSIWNMFGN